MDPAASLAWQPHPDVWLLIVALVGGYLYALAAWGPKLAAGRRPATRNQRICFFLGIAALWIGADWPIHTVAEGYLYSVHMLQHLIFQLVAAPLLLLGVPAWLWRKLLSPAPLHGLVHAITRPLPAITIVSAYTVFMHWPLVVNTVASNAVLHVLAHLALLAVSFVMWWPVLSPLPELPHLSYLGRMAYLFAHSIVPTVPASFLTFSHEPLYQVYVDAPRLAAWLDAAQDLQIAGLLMKIGGGFLLWGVIAFLFFRWHAEEQSGGPDFLYWRDFEPDVTADTLSS